MNPAKKKPSLRQKNIIQRIFTKIFNNSRFILCKYSSNTTEWFKNIKHKNKDTLIQFDIVDFSFLQNKIIIITKHQFS